MDTLTKKEKYQADALALRALNEATERTALGMTLYIGESVELSCGVSIKFRQVPGTRQIGISICAPREIKILRVRFMRCKRCGDKLIDDEEEACGACEAEQWGENRELK